MQGLRGALRKALGTGFRSLATLSEAPAAAARFGCALPPGLEVWRPATAAFPWSASTSAALQQQQQPISLSQGWAAAVLAQQPVPAAGISGGLWAPQQSGVLVEWRADSVRRKRKRAMNKHKHRKRRKLNRMRK